MESCISENKAYDEHADVAMTIETVSSTVVKAANNELAGITGSDAVTMNVTDNEQEITALMVMNSETLSLLPDNGGESFHFVAHLHRFEV